MNKSLHRRAKPQAPKPAGFTLLPAPAGTCQECAVKHQPEQPHNQQSLFYQYHFYGQHGRWPTWTDALAHCTPEVRQVWVECLAKHGVTVEP